MQEKKIISRPEPFNWSKFERTGNNAIDLVAQAIGYFRSAKRPIRTIFLKPTYFALFRAGLRLLMEKQGQHLEDVAVLTFDGVEIQQGSNLQWDNMIFEFYPLPKIKAEA